MQDQEVEILENEVVEKSSMERIDEAELWMANSGLALANCPVTHRFTPGLYIREIFMPAGSLIVSKIHLTEHPYMVMWGKVSVWTDDEGEVEIEAPFTGTTMAGTRRVLFCHTDVLWTTCHLNPDNENVEQIENRIIQKHDNPLLSQGQKDFFAKQNKLMSDIVGNTVNQLDNEN
mgnify:CR=1 FL=1